MESGYMKDLCKYPEHEKLNGRQFPIKKGVKMGVFKEYSRHS